MTEQTPVFAIGRTFKSLKSRDKKFLSFDMNEELRVLSVEGTPHGLWMARNNEDKVSRSFLCGVFVCVCVLRGGSD